MLILVSWTAKYGPLSDIQITKIKKFTRKSSFWKIFCRNGTSRIEKRKTSVKAVVENWMLASVLCVGPNRNVHPWNSDTSKNFAENCAEKLEHLEALRALINAGAEFDDLEKAEVIQILQAFLQASSDTDSVGGFNLTLNTFNWIQCDFYWVLFLEGLYCIMTLTINPPSSPNMYFDYYVYKFIDLLVRLVFQR